MRRELPIEQTVNELAASSVFFTQTAQKSRHEPGSGARESKSRTNHDTKASRNHGTTVPRDRDTSVPGNRGTQLPRDHDTEVETNQDTESSDLLEVLRQAVRTPSKEAATHRFSAAEKSRIAEIVFDYSRRGVRTSTIEITRIAVNWLLLDFDRNGVQSVLVRMLDRLHG